MDRLIIQAIVKICAKSIVLATVIVLVIGIIGYINRWDSLVAYSNAFFLAGCLIIVAGGLSRFGAGQEWSAFQLLYAESFREMSNSDRANFIINASSSVSLLILGLLSGLWLILLSAIAAFLS
jgi:hypothetical protein